MSVASAAAPRAWRLLTEPFRARTWAESLYLLLGLPVGIGFFVFTVTTVALSGGLAITFVGLPLLAATGLVCRELGQLWRRLANALLAADVPAPAPFRPKPGVLGWIGACLADGTAWRARLYALLKLPLGIAGFVTTVVFWSTGLGGLSYPAWRPFLPCNTTADGTCHHSANFGDQWPADTPFRILLVALAGLLLTLAAPWAVRTVAGLDRLCVQALLGPTGRGKRVAELERSRAAAVDSSAATLRRIERDLHDGAQSRLVAVAMNIGLAREKLAEGSDPTDAERLLDVAHRSAKQAVAELRDLARGIHPPALETGLDAALATLAAHSAVPVRFRFDLHIRPDPAIETMVYFCAAELLTNIAKHSGASTANLDVSSRADQLVLTVRDDGVGGAHIGGGTGLAGLAERVRTVDGKLFVDSPSGGPSVVRIEVPFRSGGVG